MGQVEIHWLSPGRQELDPTASKSILSNQPYHFPHPQAVFEVFGLPGAPCATVQDSHSATEQMRVEWVLQSHQHDTARDTSSEHQTLHPEVH